VSAADLPDSLTQEYPHATAASAASPAFGVCQPADAKGCYTSIDRLLERMTANNQLTDWLEYEAYAHTLFLDRDATDCQPQQKHCTPQLSNRKQANESLAIDQI
jgi:hypothetical protein